MFRHPVACACVATAPRAGASPGGPPRQAAFPRQAPPPAPAPGYSRSGMAVERHAPVTWPGEVEGGIGDQPWSTPVRPGVSSNAQTSHPCSGRRAGRLRRLVEARDAAGCPAGRFVRLRTDGHPRRASPPGRRRSQPRCPGPRPQARIRAAHAAPARRRVRPPLLGPAVCVAPRQRHERPDGCREHTNLQLPASRLRTGCSLASRRQGIPMSLRRAAGRLGAHGPCASKAVR